MSNVSIPVVDISPANKEAASQLLSAASSHGFVYIENNAAGVSPALIEDVFKLSKDFFALPIETKEQASEMGELADTVIVGNVIYTNLSEALKTVKAVKKNIAQ